jgi:hypothetical protein
MRFRITQRFDAPLDDVEATLLDAAFLEGLGRLPKLGKPQLLDVEVTGETVRRRIRYAFAGQLSSAVTAVVDPAKLTWVEDSTADRRTHRTTFRILPDHYADRLTASGTFTLESIGTRTQRVAEGDLRVRFPLVGGRVEKAIVSGMEDYARAEGDAIASWLAQRG